MQKQIDILLDSLLPFDDAKTTIKSSMESEVKRLCAEQVAHFNADWKVVEREEEFQVEIGGLRFKGRIDRIDQNDTHTLVLRLQKWLNQRSTKNKEPRDPHTTYR